MKITPIAVIILMIIPFASASYVPSSSFPKEVIFFDRLAENEAQTKLAVNQDILFTEVGVTTNANESRARIVVQSMPDCPENAPYQTDVLQCFIVSSSFDENNITQTTITFKVPKEWMTANNYKSVELRRYSYSWNNGGKFSEWEALETQLEKEDDRYQYYAAQSNGIDYFSIVGLKERKVVVQKTPETVQEIKPTTQTKTASAITGDAVKIIPASATNVVAIIFLLILKIAFIASAPFIFDKEKKKTDLDTLSHYIRTTKESDSIMRHHLKNAGWEDWQINLAFKEAKDRK